VRLRLDGHDASSDAWRCRLWEDFMRRLLLIVPFIGLLWVPFYNHTDPQLWGFPFFYWYQFVWVIISSGITWFVYQGERT
jgi:Protein of unknown function (DUF3311)